MNLILGIAQFYPPDGCGQDFQATRRPETRISMQSPGTTSQPFPAEILVRSCFAWPVFAAGNAGIISQTQLIAPNKPNSLTFYVEPGRCPCRTKGGGLWRPEQELTPEGRCRILREGSGWVKFVSGPASCQTVLRVVQIRAKRTVRAINGRA